MNNLLKSIFHESNFETSSLSLPGDRIGFFGVCKDFDVKNYFLVIFVDTLEGLLDNISSYFKVIKDFLGEEYEPAVDKNTSLVICYKIASDKQYIQLLTSNLIHEIEEDPYDFKKYVLPYTEWQAEELRKYIEKQPNAIILKILNSVLYEDNAFMKFKESPESPTLYNLVTKIFIKIPFIELEIHRKELGNLSNLIDTKLSPSLLSLKNIAINQNNLVDEKQIKLSIFGKGTDFRE